MVDRCFKKDGRNGQVQPTFHSIVPNLFPASKISQQQRRSGRNKISSTKYNIFTFLPVSLFIQFIRVTNIFYLVNAIIQSNPSMSTNSPMASIVPLLFVILLGMLRELLADLKRWREDRRTNARQYSRISGGDLSQKAQVLSQDIRVGDILELHDGQIVPTDCLLLQTHEAIGQCFVQTSSLDGEKNLKPKLVIRSVHDNLATLIKQGSETNTNLTVSVPEPDMNLYQFKGILKYQLGVEAEKQYDLELKHFLHSGSVIKNSYSVVALVLYCGMETKIILNQGRYNFKTSNIESRLNILLLINIIIILSLAGIMSSKLYYFILSYGSGMKYIYPEKTIDVWYYTGNAYATYYTLLNSLIPLALLVTLEICKMSYSRLMEQDIELTNQTNNFEFNIDIDFMKQLSKAEMKELFKKAEFKIMVYMNNWAKQAISAAIKQAQLLKTNLSLEVSRVEAMNILKERYEIWQLLIRSMPAMNPMQTCGDVQLSAMMYS